MGQYQKRKFYRLNHYIQAQELRVVDEEGKQLGVMPRGQALAQAQEKGLDLVEVAPSAKPPVAKIIDYKKFKYLEAKKKGTKKQRKTETKEIRLRPFIAENDLNTRLKRAEKFLKEKNQVRFSVIFRGRQIAKKEFGFKLLKRVEKRLADIAKLNQEPRLLGRRLIMIMSPDEKSSQKKTKNKKLGQKKI